MPGIRQRLGLDSREAEAPKEICKFLTGQFASGRMPASDVTMGARAAAVDLGQSSSSSSSSTLQRMATAAPAGERKRKGVTELDTRHCSMGSSPSIGCISTVHIATCCSYSMSSLEQELKSLRIGTCCFFIASSDIELDSGWEGG